MGKTLKEKENIKFGLHESLFVGYKIKDGNLILRFAIDCDIEESLGIECEFGEMYYLYDAVCCDVTSFEWDKENNVEMLLCEVLDFGIYDNKYNLILIEGINEIYFSFDCSKIEWIPIKLMSINELDEIENTKYYKLD